MPRKAKGADDSSAATPSSTQQPDDVSRSRGLIDAKCQEEAKEKGVKVPKATPVDKQIRGEVKPIDVPIVVAMSSELTNRLPYPQDRWRGYVLLHDGNNLPYVTDFTRGGATALGYCQAVMEFMRRIGTPNPFRKASE